MGVKKVAVVGSCNCGFGAGIMFAVLTASCSGGDLEVVRIVPDVRATELHAIEPDSALHDIRDMAFDHDGRIWILSGFEPFVHVIDEVAGEVLRFGRRGQGPGEIRNPWYFIDRAEPGVPRVWDVGNRKVVDFDLEGRVMGEVRAEASLGVVLAGYRATQFGKPLRAVEVSPWLIVQAFEDVVTRSGHLWHGLLVRLHASGAVSDTILRFAALKEMASDQGFSIFEPGPLWAACQTGTLAVLNPATHEIHRFDSNGSALDRWPATLPSIQIRRQDVEAFIRHELELEIRDRGGPDPRSPQVLRVIRTLISRFSASVPEQAPAVGIECDESGRIWVQLFSTGFDARGYGRHWWVTDGESSMVVEFPDRFQAVRFSRGRVLGYRVDELGVQLPAWVMLST